MDVVYLILAILIMVCSYANIIRLIKEGDVQNVISGWTIASFVTILASYLFIRITLWNQMDFTNWRMLIPFVIVHFISFVLIGRSLWSDKMQTGISWGLYTVGIIIFEALNSAGSF